MFTQYCAMQSCTSGRSAFITRMYPLRTRVIPPQFPGSPTFLLPGTPDLALFLTIWATRRASLARTIWATTPTRCRQHMVFRSTGDTCITSMPSGKSAFPTSTTAQPNRQSHRPVRTHLLQAFPRCRERWIQKRPFVWRLPETCFGASRLTVLERTRAVTTKDY